MLAPALGGEWREAEVSDPLGRPVVARWLLHDGSALVESAQAIGLGLVAESERDPLRASSRGLGELLAEVQDADPAEIVVFLGGTATVDGGAGLMEVLGGFRVPVRAACDVRAPLVDAARIFAAQKGATPEQAAELERRLLERRSLAPFRELPGAGAAGGLGAALAALGAELVEGARLVLDLIGFRAGWTAPTSSSPARDGGPDDVDGQSAGRGLPPLRGARRALRALRRPCRRSAGRRRGLRAQRRSRARARISSRSGGAWPSLRPGRTSSRRTGGASMRSRHGPRRAAGSPRTSSRARSGRSRP